jgi:xylulokinase
MSHVGIDLGTGSVKVMILHEDGSEGIVSRPYPVASPASGFAETDSALWLAAVRDCAAALPGISETASIGFSGQMHGVVPCRLTEGAIHPAILWADQRGKSVIPTLEKLPHTLLDRVRNSWASGMAITTILWLKENRRELYDSTELFFMPKDYIRWMATGQAATDYSDASGTLLYDFEKGDWFEELFDRLGLDIAKMPPIAESASSGGSVTPEGSQRTGLPTGVPVCIGSGDTPSAIFGSALEDEGTVQISIGTACQIVRLCTVLPSFHPALNLFESANRGTYYRMAAMLNGGLALEWVRNILGLSWDAVYEEAAKKSPPLDLHFLPYLIGERTPYMDPDARGIFSGLGLHHERIDLMHAALLGVACSVRLGLETLGSKNCEKWRLVGGSAKYPYWNWILATVLGVPLDVSTRSDSSVRGAALLGAKSIGEHPIVIDEHFIVEPDDLPGIDKYFIQFKRLYTNPESVQKSETQDQVPGVE